MSHDYHHHNHRNFLDVLTHRKAGSSLSLARRSMNGTDPDRIRPPSHRHAAPSAPWPWVDIDDAVDAAQLLSNAPPIPELCPHDNCTCWTGYPQSRFPNWTEKQVKKARIWEAIHSYRRDLVCTIYRCDVDDKGQFSNPGELPADDTKEEEVWNAILDDSRKRPSNLRVRAMFVANMSGHVLRMLGARYNIEPFFFSSSINWIPSRFQEDRRENEGDHITISFTFIKSTTQDAFEKHTVYRPNGSLRGTLIGSQKIDTQSPLLLYSNQKVLSLDLLSIHLIRDLAGSTIISYHPTLNIPTTTAPYLHERIQFAGQSVYWQNMFQSSPDPTLVLLCFIWHALYGWDEALESLYEHILALEDRVINTSEMLLTKELHVIRAHHLHYSSLLDDFEKNVQFIQETPTPFMTTANFPQSVLDENQRLLDRECNNILDEVARLKKMLHQQERRLKNVMNLVFSSVNITDSRHMREMTEAAVRDSAAMKQIAYLTMVFLPASFIAAVFGMNVREINPGSADHSTVGIYLSVALPLTAFTAWIIVAFQSKYLFDENAPFWWRLTWPIKVVYDWLRNKGLLRDRDGGVVSMEDEMIVQDEVYNFEVEKVPSREGPALPSPVLARHSRGG